VFDAVEEALDKVPLPGIPLFTRRTVLVDADAGGVDHHDLALEGG